MSIKRILIIPARSGSKRIKNKNFKKFKGEPIISYSIKTAINSKIFSKIVISTDSKKYFKYLKKFDVEVFFRSKKLSDDNATIESVLRNVLNEYDKFFKIFNEVWCLTPCSPLIKSKDLLNASKLLKKNRKKIILPVTEYPAPLEWAFKLVKNKKLIPVKKSFYKIRSQDLSKSYFDTGNFVAIPINHFKKKIIDFDKHYVGLEIPKYRSIDIDDFDDWKLAEKIYK
ncbi:acylneuraminate cytidylyltransferase family protein [Candidatus Pelagibacter sp. HIMB1495]|uniref:acylneuraminate cytidylyltransferase family protein n=1 Tax=unclassified Candidatus Pelagibacter TaxID=2647897 RepID=UPI003F824674